MKKALAMTAAFGLLTACGVKESHVRKTTDENGVEVVLNGIEPLRVKGAPASLELTEEAAIDTEKDEVAGAGLSDIQSFDVDSAGNVYFVSVKAGENTILKFDRQGRHVALFGRKGQGPGEIQGINALILTDRDEVAVTNEGNRKLIVLSTDGKLLRELPYTSNFIAVRPLDDGHFLVWERISDPKQGALFEYPISLAGLDFKAVKRLDTGFLENPMEGKQLRGTYHLQSWSVSRGMIFTGHQDRGYEIFVYDRDGRALRKIRKEYQSVPVPESHKKEFLKQFESPMFKDIIKKIQFPDGMPPFIGFASDEDGRLYVMTYETGAGPGEYIFDIFSPDGVFMMRKPVKAYHNFMGIYVKVRNGRMYAVQEKTSGYKEFKVYRLAWK